MAEQTREELVHVASEDGYSLEGVVIRPAGEAAESAEAGSAGRLRHQRPIVWTHGLTGRFSSPSTVAIGRRLAERGHVFVAGNNRGHDFGAVFRSATGQRMIGGAGWELFEDSPFDVAAWIGLAASIGSGQVILLGHSLGALKVAFYQAGRRDERVKGLIAASPPLRAGHWPDSLDKTVERMVSEGKGMDLLPWDLMDAGAGTLSARTVSSWLRTNVDVYGARTADPAIARVDVPILAFYGTEESRVGDETDLEVIRRNAKASPRVVTAMIAGSDHNYNGRDREVATVIADWVESIA